MTPGMPSGLKNVDGCHEIACAPARAACAAFATDSPTLSAVIIAMTASGGDAAFAAAIHASSVAARSAPVIV